jgi:DNA replication protein DnaC
MLDTALSAAERESLNHLEFLHRLLAEPAAARRQRAVDRRIRAAKFRELTSLEGFDWSFNAKGVDRRTVEQLATCDFVRRGENVVLVGQSGLGKSRILQAIGRAACILGYHVRYATSAKFRTPDLREYDLEPNLLSRPARRSNRRASDWYPDR